MDQSNIIQPLTNTVLDGITSNQKSTKRLSKRKRRNEAQAGTIRSLEWNVILHQQWYKTGQCSLGALETAERILAKYQDIYDGN